MKSKDHREGAKGASPYLTIREAADYLRTSERALRRYRDEGGGPNYIYHSKRVIYRLDDLEAWVNSRTQRSDR